MGSVGVGEESGQVVSTAESEAFAHGHEHGRVVGRLPE